MKHRYLPANRLLRSTSWHMSRSRVSALSLMWCVLVWVSPVAANHDANIEALDGARQTLARIRHELAYLQTLVDHAQQQPLVLPGRHRIDYARLKYELELIRHGIYELLFQPDTTPRVVQPLSGNYRQ